MASVKKSGIVPRSSRSRCAWRAVGDGVRFNFRLTPKSCADAIGALVEGPDGPHLHVKGRAVPADGAANAALEKLVAKWLGLPQRTRTRACYARTRGAW